MNKSAYRKLFVLIGLVIFGAILGFAIARITEKQQTEKQKIESSPENQVTFEDMGCENLSLFNSSYCLRDNLRQWYKYNLTNLDINLTLDQLKTQGGVCWHYANYYAEKMNQLGFNTEEVIIDTDNETSHEFAIASNKDGYCVLDQTAVGCYRVYRQI